MASKVKTSAAGAIENPSSSRSICIIASLLPFSLNHHNTLYHQFITETSIPTAMKLMTYLLTVLGGLFVIGMATPIPTDYQECGNAWYDPASYVCSNDTNTLCPIINGEPMQDCAGACYTPLKYKSVFLIQNLMKSY